MINNKTYKDLRQNRKFLAMGFDDFRESDFSLVLPLLKKYDFHSTFNVISSDITLSKHMTKRINTIIKNGSEVGDHTWFHCSFIYNDPLCNGQNPDNLEGNQEEFPTNNNLKNDYNGNGKNVFGYNVNDLVCYSDDWSTKYCLDWDKYKVKWKNLTNKQCQEMREQFSIYKDKTGMIDKLDELSNKYCGTTGKTSDGYDLINQCYKGGIFQNAKTSCNHEIWERLIKITSAFYKEQYSNSFNFCTWSYPGNTRSPFKFYGKNNKKYYDSKHTKLNNFTSKFKSTIFFDNKGLKKERSWVDVLRENGYLITHDTYCPSRDDGLEKTVMNIQLINNAKYSRIDSLDYGTNSIIDTDTITNEYPKEYFSKGKSFASQMYDGGGSFYKFIEELRKNTSNGVVQGEIFDSENTFSERVFLEQILKFCKSANIEVVSKKEAYDACFNIKNIEGNLIYNSSLVNSAKIFMPDAKNIPKNPDGYTGDCETLHDCSGDSILNVKGYAEYIHYGIPFGNLTYQFCGLGEGTIKIYKIKNSDSIRLYNNKLELASEITISNKDYELKKSVFYISNQNTSINIENLCAGIKIVFFGNLNIKNIRLYVTPHNRGK